MKVVELVYTSLMHCTMVYAFAREWFRNQISSEGENNKTKNVPNVNSVT